MEILTSPKAVSFRTGSVTNTQTSDLILSNQRQIDTAKLATPIEKNKKIQQYLDGISTENTERNNYDSTNNTSSLSNMSPMKPKPVTESRQFTFVQSDEQQSGLRSSSYFKSVLVLKNKLNSSSEKPTSSFLQIPHHQRQNRKSSSSQISIKINEEKYCKFCNQPDNFQNFIRPCLCKGNMQHVHQQCVQENIEKSYMDEEKKKFIKPLFCESCKFKYIIKSYKKFNLFNSLKDPLRHGKLLWFLFIFMILSLAVLTLIVVSILKSEQFQQHLDYIAGVVIAVLILSGIMIVVVNNILELISNHKWCILDREQGKIEDNGVIMNQDTLNLMIEQNRKKRYIIKQRIVPHEERVNTSKEEQVL